jgi:hypothetical protein
MNPAHAITDESRLEACYDGATNPLDQGAEAAVRFIEAVCRAFGAPAPDEVSLGAGWLPYSAGNLEQVLARQDPQKSVMLNLRCAADPETRHLCVFFGQAGPPGLRWSMSAPFSRYAEPGQAVARAQALVGAFRVLAAASAPLSGWAHHDGDLWLGRNPARTDPFAPRQFGDAYWLNVLGPKLLHRVGKRRLASLSTQVEALPGGGALLLTRPTPADCLSDEGRRAQARVLTQLRRGISQAAALALLRERSARLAPIEQTWDDDLGEVIALLLPFISYEHRREKLAALMALWLPDVSDWSQPAGSQGSDSDAVEASVARQAKDHAEQLVMLLHDKVPEVLDGGPGSLPRIDAYLYRAGSPSRLRRDAVEALVPAIGGYLGTVLVRHLGGRWVRGGSLAESCVIVGGRAWRPFLHASQYVQSNEAIGTFALTRFYRAAERHAGRAAAP